MRLFVGIRLSPELCAAIERATAPLRSRLPDVRWTGAHALHITLRFLGEVADGQVAALASAIEVCAASQRVFPLRTGRLGGFPRGNRAQVLWLGVDDGGATASLADCLDTAFEPLGFAREARAFTPHVTLGRAGGRKGVRMHDADGADDMAAGMSMDVDRIELIRSHLGNRPARYEVLHAAMLHGGTE